MALGRREPGGYGVLVSGMEGYGQVLTDDWPDHIVRSDHPVDGARVYSAGSDDDAHFLMLHGIGNSGAVWSPIMPALAEHGPVVAPTLQPELLAAPGGGPTETMTPLVEWLAAVAPPPWRLIGHSMGGVLSGLILRSHPELVRGAITINSPLPGVIERPVRSTLSRPPSRSITPGSGELIVMAPRTSSG